MGAVEEERLNGIKAYGWHPAGRPGANLLNSGDFAIRDAVCRQSVAHLLGRHGLVQGDVDVIALNGVPRRYQPSRSCVREGAYIFVPHHLAHAASVARPSPFESGHVLTVDGRGEYETAAFFTYEGGELIRRMELPAGGGVSIGGAYETVTRVLGFGAHGQGQTMALASLARGDASMFDGTFRVAGFDDYCINEQAVQGVARDWMGSESVFDGPRGQQLAANIQAALEDAVVALALEGQAKYGAERLFLSGGVALNCCANTKIRQALGRDVWVTHAAHDAGTALGAALEAAHLLGEPPSQPVLDAGLGPAFSPAECELALKQAGLSGSNAPLEGAVDRLLTGKVLGFFQSGMEFGPRALGHRSMVAHPGWPGIQEKVNRIKNRQSWRPFAPSVLEERAGEVFECARPGPFMTFTTLVRPEMRRRIAGVVHADGTTRPQTVGKDADPRWRRLIELFDEATGIPLLLNTSFNGRGKPIVCTPEEAIREARTLGLDALVLGDVIVDLDAERR